MLKREINGVYLRPVGEVFRYKDKLLEVVRADRKKRCEKCYFKDNIVECTKSYPFAGACRWPLRIVDDCCFREVKVDTAHAGYTMRAVGSYFTHNGKLLRVERPQTDDHFSLCIGCAFRGKPCLMGDSVEVTGICTEFFDRGLGNDVIFREVKIETDVVENENENEGYVL